MDFAALQHSVFLQVLGSAILNSLWQCFILWFIYETILLSYKSASAKFKNNLSTLLLFGCFIWFLLSFTIKILNYQRIMPNAAEPTNLQNTVFFDASSFKTLLAYASSSIPYLSVAYIFLLLFLVFRLFAAYRYVYFIAKKRLFHPTEELKNFAYKVSRQIGITKKISIWISHNIDVPATIGFLKPIILIPLASINNLSGQQLEAIILHELAHIKRNDFITNLVISVIETVMFFNPFVVLLSNVIKRERENCCDDFVLQYRYDPHSYASALLRLEQSRKNNLKLAIGAVSGKKQLFIRIKRITNNQASSKQLNYGQKIIALLLVTFCMCSIAWLSPTHKKSQLPNNTVKKINSGIISEAKLPGEIEPVKEMANIQKNKSLPSPNLKRTSVNTKAITFEQNDLENFDANNIYTADNVKKESTASSFTKENNFKKPLFFFDESNIQTPPAIDIQDFPFQKMDFNIDLSNIDMRELSKNLMGVYKEIDEINWKEIENKLRKELPKMNIKNFTQKEADAFVKEKYLLKLHSEISKKQSAAKAYLVQINDQVLALNALHPSRITSWNQHSDRVQQEYQKIQKLYQDNNTTYNYYYSDNLNNIRHEGKDECSNVNIAPPHARNRDIRIIVRNNVSKQKDQEVLKQKRYSFSFDTDKNEKLNKRLINIEISDAP